MTKSSHWIPSGVPLGMSICWGHPQPQKLNWAKASPPTGLLRSKLRKVRSKGIVTEDWVEFRVIVLAPCFTRNKYSYLFQAEKNYSQLTGNHESVQFDEHIFLVPEKPRISPLVEFGGNENPASSHFVGASFIFDRDRISERLMLEMGEPGKDRTARLEIHASRHVNIGLLPERAERVSWTPFRFKFDFSYCNPRIIQLEKEMLKKS